MLATAYTDLFRGLPTILVILLLGYGMPALDLQGVPNSPFFWAIVALVLVYSAYVAEVYRAGIESVHPSQTAAARSLGLTRGQAMRHVILPQAIRRVVPPLMNDFIGLQKDSALVAFLGVTEGLLTAQIISANDFNFTSYVGARARVPGDHGAADAVGGLADQHAINVGGKQVASRETNRPCESKGSTSGSATWRCCVGSISPSTTTRSCV